MKLQFDDIGSTKEEFENCGADFIFEFPKNVEVFLIQK